MTNSLRQRLIHFFLVEESFFRLERPRMYHPNLLAVRAVHTENPGSVCGHSQVEKPRLNRKPPRVRQQPHCKRILKGFFHFPLTQRTIQLEGRVIPIELHIELVVNNSPMQCIYYVFTHWRCFVSTSYCDFIRKS